MLFIHMLLLSLDSFMAAGLFAPILSRRGLLKLVLFLGIFDGFASYFGPTLLATFGSGTIVATYGILAAFTLIAAIFVRLPQSIFFELLPVLLSFDNVIEVSGHPVTVGCAFEFGMASSLMAFSGALISVLVSGEYRTSRG